MNSFELQTILLEAFDRIHKSDVTKACLSLQEAEVCARKLWHPQRIMVEFSQNKRMVDLLRQSNGKIMEWPNFEPPNFVYLTKEIDIAPTRPLEEE